MGPVGMEAEMLRGCLGGLVLSIVAGFVAGALMADETPWFAIWKLCNVWPASSDFSKVAFDYAKIMW